MIAHLSGRLLRKAPQEVVIDVSGVGYRVAIPVTTFYRLGEPGETVSLRVHTHVREDALVLFGFLAAHEQDLFEQLITVSGVGPKLALNILSGIEAAELADALRRRDLVRLTRIPGVGKKTAERLIVELQDKVASLATPEAGAAPVSTVKDDLVSALVHLGYGRPEAERGAERALAAAPDARFEDLLRGALQQLARR